MALLIAALVNELNYKNVIAFLTKAFEHKVVLNKPHLFIHFALVLIYEFIPFYIFYELYLKKSILFPNLVLIVDF